MARTVLHSIVNFVTNVCFKLILSKLHHRKVCAIIHCCKKLITCVGLLSALAFLINGVGGAFCLFVLFIGQFMIFYFLYKAIYGKVKNPVGTTI